MKKMMILVILLAVIAVNQVAWADNFEWYTVKDKISGAINFRSEPNLDSDILDYMMIKFCYVVPLFKIVEKKPNGWYRAKSNREGIARDVNYEYKYFWVAGWLLRKVDPQKEKLAILVPANYDYWMGINIHEKPHVFSYSISDAVPNYWEYIYASVKMTGKQIGPFVEILKLDCFNNNNKGKRFVFGEYFGFKKDNRYIKFSIPKIFYTRSTYLDYSYYSRSLTVRAKPSILSKKVGTYARGGMLVKVVGEQGYFYKTNKNKWILKQCLTSKK